MIITSEEDYINSIDPDYLDWQDSLGVDDGSDFEMPDEEEEFDTGLWEAEEAWLKHAEDRGLEDA